MGDLGGTAPLVVVGSGAAGLMAACAAAELGVRATLLTDRGIGTSNSAVAQGGLQLPEADVASIEGFVGDITRSAGPSGDTDRIEHFAESVRPTVELLQRWGLELDRDDAGELVRQTAGGLSEPRIVTAGDRIGTAILRVLRRRVTELGLDVVTKCRIVDIGPDADAHTLVTDDHRTIRATAVVLAIGGRSFEHARSQRIPTSNPANTNSTLYDAVRRLGIAETDPDRFQYQPYGVVLPDGRHSERCVPESVVGLGARVVDADDRPIAPAGADRRVLTEAMFAELERDRGERAAGIPVLRLTLGSIDRAVLLARYPHLERLLDQAALPNGDVHVVPVVHYQLGGFAVGPDCSTPVPRLYLAGEMTGGLHGHNRLMGNGITEAVVDGLLAGRAAAELVRPSTDD